MVVEALRVAGLEVYDFRNPAPGNDGFHWSNIDPDWQQWTPSKYVAALDHPLAKSGFRYDMDALTASDAVVCVLPCGRSAHLELGYAVGSNRRTAILLDNGEPELMNKMVDWLGEDLDQLILWLQRGH